jgi:hypothetical protein
MVRRTDNHWTTAMSHRLVRIALAGLLAASTIACAHALRSPQIIDLRDNPGRYQHHTISIDGTVTTSWGIPLVPFKLYKVDDGTGEVTVVSQSGRIPTRGTRVRVRGQVDDVAVIGGEAIGLHLREEALYVKR